MQTTEHLYSKIFMIRILLQAYLVSIDRVLGNLKTFEPWAENQTIAEWSEPEYFVLKTVTWHHTQYVSQKSYNLTLDFCSAQSGAVIARQVLFQPFSEKISEIYYICNSKCWMPYLGFVKIICAFQTSRSGDGFWLSLHCRNHKIYWGTASFLVFPTRL